MTGLVGTWRLFRLLLRRDRLRMPLWILTLVGLTWLQAAAIPEAYPTQRAIDAYAATLGRSPAAIATSGPAVALDTRGGVIIHEVMFIAVIGVAMMVVFSVVRHTRAEEEAGRTELLRAAVLGRHAGSAAAMLGALLASMLVGTGLALVLLTLDVPLSAASLFGASTTALGLAFAGVSLVVAQIVSSARTALGGSLAVFGVAYVIRAAGDVREDWLVWLSPIGWSQATHPLGDDERWWPLLMLLAATVVLVAVAMILATRRDVGMGLVAQRPGSPRAAATLQGPVGIPVRLQRGSVIGWAVGGFALAMLTGALVADVVDMTKDNPDLAKFLQASGQASAIDAFLATMLLLLALLATGFAVSSALRPDTEEMSGRVEQLLATGLSRTRWLLGSLLVTLVGATIVLAATGAGLGLAYAMVESDPATGIRLVGYQLLYLPAVLAVAGVAVLLHGCAPRLAKTAWAFFALCFVLSWLGALLDPPGWLLAVSPFEHAAFVPVENADPWATSLTAVVTVLAVGTGVLGLRRRDIR